MGFIMPLPQMWFGRQPKGWVHTMFSAPDSASSSISEVSSHPSPIFAPMPRQSRARVMVCSKGVGARKKPCALMQLIITCLQCSRYFQAMLAPR